jgi:23S rRNA pseudouridine2604 synthase
MPERGRSRSPGAKGTAYPRAQRPQKSVPAPSATPGAPASAGSLKGKTLHLQPKTGRATFDSTEQTAPRPVKAALGRTGLAGSRPGKLAAGKPTAGKAGRSGGLEGSGQGSASAFPAGPSAGRPGPRPAASVAPKAPLDPNAPVRISKLLAERGLCSRREADAYIERGWVFVDGERVSELGSKALPSARLSLAPEAATQQNRQMTLLLHKPVGYVSGQPEPGFLPAVTLIQPENQARGPGDLAFEPRWMKDLAPAGRLDIDSTGLLVLTQDGRVARQLIGEDSTVEKEYLVRVDGRLIKDGLALLNHGLSLDGKALRPARVEWLNEDQLRFILREGKKRQIRRMCELVGLNVVGLKRVRIGQVMLGELPLGQWRYLRPGETF